MGVDDGDGEARQQDEADDRQQRVGERLAGVRQDERERGCACDRQKQDVPPAKPVGERAAHERTCRTGRQEQEDKVLGDILGDAEFVHRIVGEIVRDASVVPRADEYEHDEKQNCRPDLLAPFGAHDLPHAASLFLDPERQALPVPAGDIELHEDGGGGDEREPDRAEQAELVEDEDRHQRRQRLPGVAADLKDRLGEAAPRARRHIGDAGAFGVEDRRPDAHEEYGQQDHAIGGRERQHEHAGEREGHTERQQVGRRLAVGIDADHRLHDRRGEIQDERNEADLGERQVHLLLEEEADGLKHRLDRVVEQMDESDQEQDAVHRFAGGIRLQLPGGNRCGGTAHGGFLLSSGKG